MTAPDARKFEELKKFWATWEENHREKIATNGFVMMASAEVTSQVKFLVGQVDKLEAELAKVKEDLQLRLERDDRKK